MVDYVTTLINLIITVFVTWFSGDTWVSRNERKREYSFVLKNSIKNWRIHQQRFEYIPIKVNEETWYEHPKIELPIFDYSKSVKQHIDSGYPTLWEAWLNYKEKGEAYLEQRALLMEEINQLLKNNAKDKEYRSYYPRVEKYRPESLFFSENIVECILDEWRMRNLGYPNYSRGEPELKQMTHKGRIKYALTAKNETLSEIVNQEEAESLKEYFMALVRNKKIKKKYDDLSPYLEEAKKTEREFSGKLKELVEPIELGHNIKGKCDNCIKTLGLF